MMKVKRRQLAQLIGQRLEGGQNPAKLAQQVAAYLISEHRVDELAPLMRDTIEYRAARGLVEASVTAAYELDEKVVKEISGFIKLHYPLAKRQIINRLVNKQLIGGVKINVVNDQLDLSIRAKLNKFKTLNSPKGV